MGDSQSLDVRVALADGRRDVGRVPLAAGALAREAGHPLSAAAPRASPAANHALPRLRESAAPAARKA